MAEVIRK